MKVLKPQPDRSLRRVLLGVALLATLPVWWLAAAWWANGVTGYLGAPGVGVASVAWLGLHAVSAGVIIAGAPATVRGRWQPGLLVGTFALLAGVIALPNLMAGAVDGLRPAGLVVGSLSIVQAAMAIVGLTNSSVPRLRRSGGSVTRRHSAQI